MSRAGLALALLLVAGPALAQEPDEDDIAPVPSPPPPPPSEPAQQPPPAPAPPPPAPVYETVPVPVLVARPRTERVEIGPDGFPHPIKPSLRVMRLTVGAAARSLYHVGFGGVEAGFAAGREGPRGAWYFTLDAFGGATGERLPAGHLQIGFLGEGKLDKLRIGCGTSTGLFLIRRATDGTSMSVLTFGPHLAVSYDLATFAGGTTLLIAFEGGVDIVFFANTAMFNGKARLGVRF